MQDFVREEHSRYVTGRDSVHPAYPFQLSARDLARFGLLFARKGRWNDQQIVPEDWVAESTASYSTSTSGMDGYGYLWWIAADGRHLPFGIPDGSYTARGAGGHYVLVIPQWDIVIVHRVNTFQRSNRVTGQEFGQLTRLVLEARPAGR
jgi:CubicO group peptidase (beta-lactamase class C family)